MGDSSLLFFNPNSDPHRNFFLSLSLSLSDLQSYCISTRHHGQSRIISIVQCMGIEKQNQLARRAVTFKSYSLQKISLARKCTRKRTRYLKVVSLCRLLQMKCDRLAKTTINNDNRLLEISFFFFNHQQGYWISIFSRPLEF